MRQLLGHLSGCAGCFFLDQAEALMDYRYMAEVGEKSSVFGPKVSKNLNWAEYIVNLIGFYSVCVTKLQYFCGGKKIV